MFAHLHDAAIKIEAGLEPPRCEAAAAFRFLAHRRFTGKLTRSAPALAAALLPKAWRAATTAPANLSAVAPSVCPVDTTAPPAMAMAMAMTTLYEDD